MHDWKLLVKTSFVWRCTKCKMHKATFSNDGCDGMHWTLSQKAPFDWKQEPIPTCEEVMMQRALK